MNSKQINIQDSKRSFLSKIRQFVVRDKSIASNPWLDAQEPDTIHWFIGS